MAVMAQLEYSYNSRANHRIVDVIGDSGIGAYLYFAVIDRHHRV